MRLHWLDLIVFLIIIRGIVLGYRRGLSGELLRFLGILCALYLSSRFSEAGVTKITQHLSIDRSVALPLSFAGIFLIVIVFFYMLNRTMHHMMQLPAIATVEHAGGALLGGAKAALAAAALLILLSLVKVESISEAVSQKSFSGPIAISAAPGAYRLAVRVYPGVQSIPAEEMIEQLPAVKQRTELEFSTPTAEGGGAPRSGTDPSTRRVKR